MRQGKQVSRNLARVREGSFRVDVETVSRIDHFPALQVFAMWPAIYLEPDQCKSRALEYCEQMWLDSSDVPAIVPVHQTPLPDCINEIHARISN